MFSAVTLFCIFIKVQIHIQIVILPLKVTYPNFAVSCSLQISTSILELGKSEKRKQRKKKVGAILIIQLKSWGKQKQQYHQILKPPGRKEKRKGNQTLVRSWSCSLSVMKSGTQYTVGTDPATKSLRFSSPTSIPRSKTIRNHCIIYGKMLYSLRSFHKDRLNLI